MPSPTSSLVMQVDVVSFASKAEASVASASWVLAVEALNALQVVKIETGHGWKVVEIPEVNEGY